MILVLDGGKVVQYGSHDELIQREGAYKQVFDLQSRIEDELQEDLALATA